MTTFSQLFPGEATLIARRCFVDPGSVLITVPAIATIARLSAVGCGGQGEFYGGGGAFARSVVNVTAGEALTVQTGNTSTASTPGDSGVRRGSVWLVYADRGRGNSEAGLASRSIGDVKRDGQRGLSGSGTYGNPGSDAIDYGRLGFEGLGVYDPAGGPTGPGGGGHLTAFYDNNGVFVGNNASFAAAGCGQVTIEFFDINPGY